MSLHRYCDFQWHERTLKILCSYKSKNIHYFFRILPVLIIGRDKVCSSKIEKCLYTYIILPASTEKWPHFRIKIIREFSRNFQMSKNLQMRAARSWIILANQYIAKMKEEKTRLKSSLPSHREKIAGEEEVEIGQISRCF